MVKYQNVSEYYENYCRVANFADIIKIATKILKILKVKRIRSYVIKKQSMSAFIDITKAAGFQYENADVSRLQHF